MCFVLIIKTPVNENKPKYILHWNTGCETCVILRLVYCYGQMVSLGGLITKLILIYVHTKANDIKSQKQKAVFSFSFLLLDNMLVRNRSLNLHFCL